MSGLPSAFTRFWFGETLSQFGTQVTALALPLTAILAMDASPGQLGLLGTAQFLPYLLLTLPVGAWLDRRRKRPVLLAAHLARALLIGSIPVAAAFGLLRFEVLLAVVFLVGSFTVAYEVGWLAYLPSVVDRSRLVAANSRLVASSSAAQVGGPGIAGLLVAAVTAPFALVVDAVSYVAAAVSLATVRAPEAEPEAGAHAGSILERIAEGLRVTLREPILVAFALEAAAYNLFQTMIGTLLVLYAVRELGLSTLAIGGVMSVGAVGALVGSVVAAPLGRRIGIGGTFVVGALVACSAPLAIPLTAAGAPLASAAILGTVSFLGGFGVSIFVVHVLTVRQTIAPEGALARLNAAYRTLTYGAIPIGALSGGLIAEAAGLRTTLTIAALGLALAPIFVLSSPIPRFRSLDDVLAARRAPRSPTPFLPGAVEPGAEVESAAA